VLKLLSHQVGMTRYLSVYEQVPQEQRMVPMCPKQLPPACLAWPQPGTTTEQAAVSMRACVLRPGLWGPICLDRSVTLLCQVTVAAAATQLLEVGGPR